MVQAAAVIDRVVGKPDGRGRVVASQARLGLAVVVLLALATSWVIYERAIAVDRVLLWDEPAHNLWGLLLLDDLARARWFGFAFDTYRQDFWPPLHPWYLAAFFRLFGPSTAVARLSSLVAFAGASLALYAGGQLLATPDDTASASATRPGAGAGAAAVSGIVAAASFLLAGGVQVLAGLSMTEMLGIFWLAASFWLYALATRPGCRPRAWTHVGLGLAVFATYMVRINLGVLVALAVAAEFVLHGRWLGWRPNATPRVESEVTELAARRRGHLLAALGLGLPLALWFAYPPRIAKTLAILPGVEGVGPDRFSLDGLLFYPRAMLWLAGSWPLLLLWLLALAVTLRPRCLRSNGRLRLLVLLLGLHLFFAELSFTKMERFSLPLAVGLSLLLGFWAGRLTTTLLQSDGLFAGRRPLRWAIGSLASMGVVAVLIGHPTDLPNGVAPRLGPPGSELADYVADDLRQNGPALVVASLADAPNELDWRLAEAGLLTPDGSGALASASDLRFVDLGQGRLPSGMPSSWRDQANHYPGTSGTYTAYFELPLGADHELVLAASNFGRRLAASLAHHPIDRILVLTRDDSEITMSLIQGSLAPLGFRATSASPRPIRKTGVGAVDLTRP